MMQVFYEFIQQVGFLSLDFFWFPVAIWTVPALLILLILKSIKSLNPLYQYHVRVAIISSLPIGVLLSFLTQKVGSSSLYSFFDTVVIVVQNPILVDPATTSSLEFIPSWIEPNFLIGITSACLAFASLIKLIRISFSYISLKKLNSCLNKTSLSSFLNYDDKIFENVQIAFNEDQMVPVTFGARNPIIVLPISFKENSIKTSIAIEHELVHIKRGDYFIQLIISLSNAIVWFHPIIRTAKNEIETWREISCDQEVLNTNNISVRNYANILFELIPLSRDQGCFSVNMAVQESTLKKRIQFMKNHRNNKITMKKSIYIFLLMTFIILLPITAIDLSASKGIQESSSLNVHQNHDPFIASSVDPDKMPKMIGGVTSLMNKIVYPEQARKDGTQGRVLIQFTVDKKGNVQNPIILEGIGNGCDEAALEAINNAKFEPGIKDNKPVNVQITLPIVFKLDNENGDD